MANKQVKYSEIARATVIPDVYSGKNHDQISNKPNWHGWFDGDMDGEGVIGPLLKLAAKTFPPGTKISIQTPICPCCNTDKEMQDKETCKFDWDKWTIDQYS